MTSLSINTPNSDIVIPVYIGGQILNEKTLITWDRVILNDSDNVVFEINTDNQSLVFKRDLKRVEILLQLTSNTSSDLANFTWYTQLNHIKVDNWKKWNEFKLNIVQTTVSHR